MFAGAGDQVLIVGDHIILASQEGSLLSLDRRGRVMWRKKLDDRSDEIRRLILLGNVIGVVRLNAVEQLDSKTGASRSKTPAVDFIRDADSAQTVAFLIDARGLRSLSNSTQPD